VYGLFLTDGKYVAYSDAGGIHVKLLSTGEERSIPTLGEAPTGTISYVAGWFSSLFCGCLDCLDAGSWRDYTHWSRIVPFRNRADLLGPAAPI
jgi:hypothetical protein